MPKSEHSHQFKVVQWARAQGLKIHRIHNGGKRTAAQVSYAIAEGELPGVPDLFIPRAAKGFHGYYIEMKKPGAKWGKMHKERQERVHACLRDEGYKVDVFWNAGDAINSIEEYIS
jgi:G:T-mismatch repair DNA endonuclease (very short patch repair protein)